MKFNKNEKLILDYLVDKKDYKTADEISIKFKISVATVYRTIKKMNLMFSPKNLVLSKKGKGLKLNYELYLNINNYNFKNRDKLPTERRNEILLKLLFKSPIKVKFDYLFSDYFLGEASINKDISIIKQFLLNYNLKFWKKDEYVWIEGSEENIRKLINRIVINLNLINSDMSYNNLKKRDYDIDFVLSQIERIEKELETLISYPYNLNIFSHIYILINRFRKGKIKFELEIKREWKKNYNKKIFEVSKKAIERLSEYLNVKLPEIEIDYLYQYLISSRVYKEENGEEILKKETKKITKYFINEIKKNTKLKFNNIELKKDLISHIEPMLQRLKNGIEIKNDLLDEIKIEYSKIFKEVKKVSGKVAKKFKLSNISEEESAFITLYFMKNIEETRNEKNIIIICSSGVGTSELLKVKVRKLFPEINIIDVMSKRSYLQRIEDYKNLDFILTTVNFEEKIEIPCLLVSAIFIENDRHRVEKIIKENKYADK